MSKLVFLDSNVFLHYRDFDQIVWPEVLQADNVNIIIPPVVIRELNKHKDTHHRKRVRSRAGAVLKKLHGLFASNLQSQLREGVIVSLEDRDPVVDFALYGLSREVQDDHLIATVIMYRNEYPDAEIMLVTSDNGLILMAKARRNNIQAVSLPESLKLDEEPDAEQERIRDLEEEIRKLKSMTPQLSLVFEDGNQHTKFALSPPLELSPEEIERELKEVAKTNPKRELPPNTSDFLSDVSGSGARTLGDLIQGLPYVPSLRAIAEYNSKLDRFYEEYVLFVKSKRKFENLQRRTIEVRISLLNDGTAPADDVDVFLHFPDGIVLRNSDDFPESPQPPKPPSRPESFWEETSHRDVFSGLLSDLQAITPKPFQPPPNTSSPRITGTGGHEVEVHVHRVKHMFREGFDPLLLTFESYQSSASFQIDYKILAANLPSHSLGRLHIIVQK